MYKEIAARPNWEIEWARESRQSIVLGLFWAGIFYVVLHCVIRLTESLPFITYPILKLGTNTDPGNWWGLAGLICLLVAATLRMVWRSAYRK
jgi:hypothetical protein